MQFRYHMQHGRLSDGPDFRANVYENVKGYSVQRFDTWIEIDNYNEVEIGKYKKGFGQW